MKLHALALTAIALSSAATIAAASSPAGDPLKLGAVAAHMESRYPGEVVAIQFDGSGDTSAHYHVDMQLREGGLAILDVDAVTLAIAWRDILPPPAGSATLAGATALVATHLPGDVVVAELDSSGGVTPHYDIDVRLPQGALARVTVDPATRQIGWRNPPILD